MNKLRVAVIGTGMIANSAHFPALNDLRKEGLVDVVGVADIREEVAAETAKRHNVPNYYSDPQKMLDELKPDFVAVCTPNMYHKEWTIKALRAGAHVACEKPSGLCVADIEEMWKTAEECGKMLFPCQCMRWRNYMQQSKELVSSGELGDVYFSDIEFIRRIGVPTWGMFHMKEHNFGGPFCDLGVHLIDLSIWLMGNPTPVAVSGNTYCKFADNDSSDSVNSDFGDKMADGTFDVEDLAMGMIRFDNGAVLQIEFSWASNIKSENRFVELRGTKSGSRMSGIDRKFDI